MPQHSAPLSRRRVLLAGAGTAAALLGPAPGAAATGGRSPGPRTAGDPLQPNASYWFPDSLPFTTAVNTGHGLRWYEDGAATVAGRAVEPSRAAGPAATTAPAGPYRGSTPGHFSGLRRCLARRQQFAGRGALGSPATVEPFPARLPSGAATVLGLDRCATPSCTAGSRTAAAVSGAGRAVRRSLCRACAASRTRRRCRSKYAPYPSRSPARNQPGPSIPGSRPPLAATHPSPTLSMEPPPCMTIAT